MNLRPTDHYHIGAGVAWSHQAHLPAGDRSWLPAEVFGRLQGGRAAEFACHRGDVRLRIYDSAADALAALKEATIIADAIEAAVAKEREAIAQFLDGAGEEGLARDIRTGYDVCKRATP